jgi:hypothetical protein
MENRVHNEDTTKHQIEQLLSELTAAQQSYGARSATPPADLEKQRVAWLSIKDRTYLHGDALNAWKEREPGLVHQV